MPKNSREGRGLKRVLEWVLDRDIVDAEIAGALNKPPATYSRRKDAADFPTYEELDQIGRHFGINPRWLQVEFGYLEVAEVDEAGRLRTAPSPLATATKTAAPAATTAETRISKMKVRKDAPPLG
ncbi:hypothetical protein SEA_PHRAPPUCCINO_40 [Mycobacterium phage Phrappuccino]|uniref:Immunity repressor n=1 Tax=Mycobacterium phage Phrappuccino TaxID=2591223 RepID=A0A514DE51_9CAUD|nr:hypothetical protein KHQ87_gp040 [Mycobacterium phage Phrappuccino]QDH91878.1 hypothetical protein SEA_PHRAPPUCCINO_40 [Mycobacterium phage Phrappuccino]QIQ63346.1 hypothetical protein SEA_SETTECANDELA_40 [Mycobacterium phage Settecandela]